MWSATRELHGVQLERCVDYTLRDCRVQLERCVDYSLRVCRVQLERCVDYSLRDCRVLDVYGVQFERCMGYKENFRNRVMLSAH